MRRYERTFLRPLLPGVAAVENAAVAPLWVQSGHDRPRDQGAETTMTIKRMDHVGVVVEDLKAAVAFFVELGLELEGETTVEGEWADQLIGLDGVRADIAFLRTPDGIGRVELSTFQTPVATSGPPRAPVNVPGIPRITFVVDSVDEVFEQPAPPRRRARGRGRAVRGHLPLRLRSRPRRRHHRAGRGAPLNGGAGRRCRPARSDQPRRWNSKANLVPPASECSFMKPRAWR